MDNHSSAKADYIEEAVKKIAPSLRATIDREREKHHLSILTKIKDIKMALAEISGDQKFLSMTDKDLYWNLKLPLFNVGIKVLHGFKTKTGENAISMRRIIPDEEKYPPEPPEYDIPVIGLIISEGPSTEVVIDALARNEKLIDRMESTFENELTIFLKSGIDCKKLIEGVVDLTESMEAVYEQYYPDKNAIEFIWDKFMK